MLFLIVGNNNLPNTAAQYVWEGWGGGAPPTTVVPSPAPAQRSSSSGQTPPPQNPHTKPRYAFSAACTVLGLLAFSTLIGSAASLATNWDATNTARTEQLDEMSHYMRYRKVPKETQDAILSYLDYTWTSHQST